MATVTSYGAARTVTGSCHLLKVGGVSILIDCGMFQGDNETKNYESFGFDPSSIDFLILTHAHIDHIGRVPKLVKEGFDGTIIATRPTFEIGKIMILDSARIMQEEYQTLYKKARRAGREKQIKPLLYEEADVLEAFRKKKILADYNKPIKLPQHISVTFRRAGHILGSAFVEIAYSEHTIPRRIVFSGDIGSRERLIIEGLEYDHSADNLYVESTYGDRFHKDLDETIQEFKNAVIGTLGRGGNILIPSFALERTQEILCVLREMYESGELPECQVFLDSPLAISATAIYRRYGKELNERCDSLLLQGKNPFSFPYLTLTRTPKQSRQVNDVQSRAIIIAGSGMCNGGRIMHHLKHRLWNPDNAVIFVGYQAEGTLGRKIVDGADTVRIYGEEIAVLSQVYTINGFSAHGDQKDLIDWMAHFKELGKIFLIHGENDKMEIFRDEIEAQLGIRSHIVKEKETIYL